MATSTAAPLLQACTTYELVKWHAHHAHVQPAKLFPKTFAVETVSRISFCDLSFLNFSQNVSRGCLLDVRRIHTAQGTSPPHCGCAAMCRTRCISPPHLGVVVQKSMSWERKKNKKRLKRCKDRFKDVFFRPSSKIQKVQKICRSRNSVRNTLSAERLVARAIVAPLLRPMAMLSTLTCESQLRAELSKHSQQERIHSRKPHISQFQKLQRLQGAGGQSDHLSF